MNFKHKVDKLINDFYRENGYKPNELLIGELEEFELKGYIRENMSLKDSLNIRIDSYNKKVGKFEFLNLKVRFMDEKILLKVLYNPHYE